MWQICQLRLSRKTKKISDLPLKAKFKDLPLKQGFSDLPQIAKILRFTTNSILWCVAHCKYQNIQQKFSDLPQGKILHRR